MKGCHVIGKVLGGRPGMAGQKTELVRHDAVRLFSQWRDGCTPDLSPITALYLGMQRVQSRSPSSCLDFTLPLRCGQKRVDVRKTLATEIRGLNQGLHTSCGLRWGTKKLRARGSPFPVLQWMDALLQLFSSEISLAGSRGIHKEVPAWWRLPFREWRSEQPFFRLWAWTDFTTLKF